MYLSGHKESISVYSHIDGELLFTCTENDVDILTESAAIKWAVDNRKRVCGADFSGFTISDLDLSGETIKYCNFTGSTISNCNFSKANLCHSIMYNCTISNCNLDGSVIMHSDLSFAKISSCSTNDVSFKSSNLHDVDLFDISLNSCVMHGSYGCGKYIKSIHTGAETVVYTSNEIYFGCHERSVLTIKDITRRTAIEVDGKRGALFWDQVKSTVFHCIENNPAEKIPSISSKSPERSI